MRHFLAVTAALLWSAVAAFAADPVGTVTVSKTGETYRVVWVVGSTRYIGTGIGNKDFIAVSYRSGNDTGLALYGADGGNWAGVWTYAGGQNVGAEFWKRR